jgi:hypothetical protein
VSNSMMRLFVLSGPLVYGMTTLPLPLPEMPGGARKERQVESARQRTHNVRGGEGRMRTRLCTNGGVGVSARGQVIASLLSRLAACESAVDKPPLPLIHRVIANRKHARSADIVVDRIVVELPPGALKSTKSEESQAR